MIFIDESGDWGFSAGGSKYTTIAEFLPKDPKPIKNYMKSFKKRMGMGKAQELHASSLKFKHRKRFIDGLLNHQFFIIAITMDKSKVKASLKDKPNILFNYQAGQLLTPYLSKVNRELVIFDRRSLKIASGRSLFDYLTIEICVTGQSEAAIDFQWGDSQAYLGLQATDIIANAIWQHYEKKQSDIYNSIKERIILEKTLFF